MVNNTFLATLRKTPLLILCACSLLSGNAYTATVFLDDFNGSALDETVWRLPTGEGTFFGRTQIKPAEYGGQNLRPVVAGGTVTLQLDTYNASAITPGDSFWGQEIQTIQTFLPGAAGISVKTRMRFVDAPAGGLVGGFFTWGYDGSIRDEIDIELLTNDVSGDRFLTNLYNNDSFTDPGDAAFVSYAGYDMTQWNTYEIRWLPDRVQWLLNGVQLRERIADVSGHPSEVRLNITAPDAGFADAYNAALQPATNAGSNMQYQLEIDYVRVSSVPLPPAFLLFSSALMLMAWVGRRRL